jgi:phosphate transport system permease protein
MPDRIDLTPSDGMLARTGVVTRVGTRAGTRLADRLAAAIVWISASLIAAAFLWIVGSVVIQGWSQLSWTFLIDSPQDAGRAGGIGSILVSTLLILTVCLAVAVPLGIGTAMLLAEFTRAGGWFGRVVRYSLDVLAGVPSIVFGLFGNAFFSLWLGLGFSILSGGLTLACMVLPILIRTTEEGFRTVPDDYRRAAAALGLSQATTIWHVLLPAAMPGLVVGLILGIGRALAETAALIFTSGAVDRMPTSLLDSGRALSLHIYDLSMNVPGGETRAYGAATVLIVMLLIINTLASGLTDRWLHRVADA